MNHMEGEHSICNELKVTHLHWGKDRLVICKTKKNKASNDSYKLVITQELVVSKIKS